jgi:hypothetical protein
VFGPMKEALRGRTLIGAKLVKDATKKLFCDEIKKKLVKLWNRSVEVEGITLKSDISFVSLYLKEVFFLKKSPFTF